MKKFLCIVLAAVFVLAFAACGAPKEMDAMQQQLEALQALLEQQNKTISELNETLSQLQEQNQEEGGKISELEELLREQIEQKELMEKRLANLMGQEIEFTEEFPVYGPREDEQIVASFDNYYFFDYGNAFNDFYNYYQEEIKDKMSEKIFVLDPGDNEIGWDPHQRRKYFDFTVQGYAEDGTFLSPMINEQMMIYDEALGKSLVPPRDDIAGGPNYSIYLNVYLAPFAEFPKVGYVYIRFGNKNGEIFWEDRFWGERYFNIYLNNGQCVGTCYYTTYCYVSRTWFEKYIKNNLLGGK